MITKNCQKCNKEYSIKKSVAGKSTYCSRECYLESFTKPNDKEPIFKICKTCNKEKPLNKFKKTKDRNGKILVLRNCGSCKYRQEKARQEKGIKLRNPPFLKENQWFKICSSCKSEKVLTEFVKDKRNSFGYSAECKACSMARYRVRKPLKPKPVHKDVKICVKCGMEKSLRCFKKGKRKDGSYNYSGKCNSCINNTPLNLATYVPFEKEGAWFKFCVRCKKTKPLKKFAKKLKSWGYCKPCNANHSRDYFSRKKGAKFSVKFDITEIIKRDGLYCYLCNKKLSKKSATLDHLIPLSRGGNHTPENVKLACLSCNSSKNNKTVSEYKKWRGDYNHHRAKISAFV